MFGFFSRLKAVSFPKPSSRQIFKYWNGSSYVLIDPLLVEERLDLHESFVASRHPQIAADGDLEAFNICVDAYSKAFEVQVFDGKNGLTRAELFALMATFDAFMWSLKKSTSDSVTPVESTDAISQDLNETTMSDTSESTKTSGDNGCGNPSKCNAGTSNPSACTLGQCPSTSSSL